ncbi:Phosphatidylinositol 3,4,5-trisphosphate 3-phosphatase and dual-specificity protein phosphatase PTEN [Colletotrichum tanaceti]|uniref:phosphatidylinositol-3,4,5-trisphosphate 3-phosphatase n=1 Tax=Colletotrichum tanaceti TaxID=1306861 RepID=A0A4U6X401_9PEZI|nr:Phosphatidylinositol 3,4,5-trisphosphate 3-phosphatase and dual-specificity protein phosphatase PTEN [Colletotrichum tanaceti]KAJ0167407.1 Phosphatidylinositol 3,4,5-trisphosphate 3-phosphatase and dual-specificity protein phosphatase PTEN [Colletotrichum tanaceti]TKW49895.1 Phosphatidylinositol 3,4,5-trisphosphate 3-phosphatase and dual-specificity protein phosphatase PTEN [Colletotrichum tanaceti]
MASILRQIVAGPRARHAESDLDLCYVTSNIIATSGPSGTYPQRAYRNPLDRLVTFLDSKHKDNWAIWEFRAEGTGYPDDEVYGRVRHYPWPDHHPPPFRLIPMIMASMRNWLHGGNLEKGDVAVSAVGKAAEANTERVVVVHCKAGKGRSGTVSCSYLISECGWKPEEALTRFTERRMRPKFGAGISIPSQLRTITYVDRWTKGGKKYIDRAIEIVEIHVWGLRSGVKFDVEGFTEEGKKIEIFHTFKKSERIVVQGDAPSGGGVGRMMTDMATVGVKPTEKAPKAAPLSEPTNTNNVGKPSSEVKAAEDEIAKNDGSALSSEAMKLRNAKTTSLIRDPVLDHGANQTRSETEGPTTTHSSTQSAGKPSEGEDSEPGGMAVILKPKETIRIPNSDINISVERRNRTSSSMGLTMVTAVAHVWFNVFFEGNGPEQDGKADASGVFEIDWEAMDGIKGSSRKGSRAFDKIAVVWRVADSQRAKDGGDEVAPTDGEIITEPSTNSPVPQMRPADWKGNNKEDPIAEKHLGLRIENPDSADVSRASSVKEADIKDGNDTDSLEGVKTSGPFGEDKLDAGDVDVKKIERGAGEATGSLNRQDPGPEPLSSPDTATGTTAQGTAEVKK